MADPQVEAVWTPAEGLSGQVSIQGQLSATFKQLYCVKFNQSNVDIERAYNADASALPAITADDEGRRKKIPPLNDAIGSYVMLTMSARTVGKDYRFWIVECEYSLASPGQEPRPADGDDDDRWAIDVNISTVPYDYEVQRDVDGNLIVNKAGDAVAGVMAQKKRERITISFNCVTVDWEGIDSAFGLTGLGCVNSEDFTLVINGQERVFEEGKVHFEDYTVSYRKDPDGETYPRVTYILGWAVDGWKRLIANKGFNEVITGQKRPIRIGGAVISSPMYLKSSGGDQVRAVNGDAVEDISTDGEGTQIFEHVDLGEILIFDLDS